MAEFQFDFLSGNIITERDNVNLIAPDTSIDKVLSNISSLGSDVTYREPKIPEYAGLKRFVFSGFSFANTLVTVTLEYDSNVQKIHIFPPFGNSEGQRQDCANKIVKVLADSSPKEIYPKYQFAEFEWGSIKVSTDRQDGFGAVITYGIA